MQLHVSTAALVFTLLTLVSSGAHAQSNPPPVDRSASRAAHQQVSAASAEHQKAQGALNAARLTARKEFEAAGDFQAAQQALREAQTALEQAQRPVLAALRQKPEYAAAKAAKNKAEAQREAATPEARTEAALAVMHAGSIVSKMEGEALAGDPGYVSAKDVLMAANQRLKEIEQEVDASVRSSPQIATAQAEQEAAKQRLDEARKTLAEALDRERQADAQRRQQIIEAERQRQQQLDDEWRRKEAEEASRKKKKKRN